MIAEELQQQIRDFGRLYVASSHVSRAVMRCGSRQHLFEEVVQILCEVGKFRMCSVLWHDPERRELVPCATSGDVHDYAGNVHIYTDARPEGEGPGGMAFRTGTTYVCNDFMNDPRTLPWREEAIKSQWQASAAVPIFVGGSVCAMLSVYSAEKNFFGATEIELLQQVALDLSFGIEHLEGEERRRTAEAALCESEERLQQSVRVANIGIFEHDHLRDRIYWSPEMRRIGGWSESETVTLEMHIQRVHPEDRERITAAIRRSHDPAGDGQYDVEHRLAMADQSTRWISVSGRTFFEGEGSERRAARTVGAVRDVTAQRLAEEQQRKLEERLFQAEKLESIGRLAGGVAHDFNNMLTVINGYSQLLLGRLSPNDPLRNTLVQIQKAGERAGVLTRQLLAYSRKQVLKPQVLDLNQALSQMKPMLERLLGDQVQLVLEPRATDAAVHVDPNQMENVIVNLASNGRDWMPEGGRLVIETSTVELDESHAQAHGAVGAGRFVMLTVSDTGMGMDEKTRQRIFEPFFTSKPAGKGSGLGLSIVQGIIAQSGGHINVYSEVGRGSTFKIYLPLMGESAASEAAGNGQAVEGGAETIVVVEDLPQVRAFVAEALRSFGYRVIPTGNAAEALLLCERDRGRIDLVLTDVVMPNVNGTEMVRRLKQTQPELKVLFMSGFAESVVLHKGVLENGVGFIEKPFSPEELGEKVRGILLSARRGGRG